MEKIPSLLGHKTHTTLKNGSETGFPAPIWSLLLNRNVFLLGTASGQETDALGSDLLLRPIIFAQQMSHNGSRDINVQKRDGSEVSAELYAPLLLGSVVFVLDSGNCCKTFLFHREKHLDTRTTSRQSQHMNLHFFHRQMTNGTFSGTIFPDFMIRLLMGKNNAGQT